MCSPAASLTRPLISTQQRAGTDDLFDKASQVSRIHEGEDSLENLSRQIGQALGQESRAGVPDEPEIKNTESAGIVHNAMVHPGMEIQAGTCSAKKEG